MASSAVDAAAMTAAAGLTAVAVVGGYIRGERARWAAPSDRRVLDLTFPVGAAAANASAALQALSGMTMGTELVFEVRSTSQGIDHLVHVPEADLSAVRQQLQSAIPGLRAERRSLRSVPSGERSARLVSVPRHVVLSTDDAAGACRAVLASVAHLQPGEFAAIRWALRSVRPTSGASLAEVAWHGYRNVPDPPAAWVRKTDGPGFVAAGQVLSGAVTAARAAQITNGIVAALRSRRTAHGSLRFRADGKSQGELPRTTSRSGWMSIGEILPLTGWPIGAHVPEGVRLGATRQLPASSDVARSGRFLFTGFDAQGPRPVALSGGAMLRHAAVTGVTGSGKSTVMIHGATSDIERGFGGALLDPKNGLVSDQLDRIDPRHADRIAVIDPSRDGGLVGLDLFGSGDPDMRAEAVLAALRRVFADSWGPRSDTYLRAGLRLLAEDPGATLVDWPRVYGDVGYRRRLVERLRDPIQRAEWSAFEDLSAADQANRVAAPMSRIMAIIGRPRLRAVLAQPQPKLDIARHLEHGGWIFVAVSPGPIGQAAADFITSMAMYCIWSAVEARAAVPADKRRPLGIYIDELSSLNGLPIPLDSLFERARGLGGAITVAAQSLGRVPEQTRASLLSNVGTLISFRAGADEAARIAREMPGLGAQDLQGLGPFEVAARVSSGAGGGAQTVTGRTEPMPPAHGAEELIRRRSFEQFGRTLEEIDAMIADRYEGRSDGDGSVRVGRARRAS